MVLAPKHICFLKKIWCGTVRDYGKFPKILAGQAFCQEYLITNDNIQVLDEFLVQKLAIFGFLKISKIFFQKFLRKHGPKYVCYFKKIWCGTVRDGAGSDR